MKPWRFWPLPRPAPPRRKKHCPAHPWDLWRPSYFNASVPGSQLRQSLVFSMKKHQHPNLVDALAGSRSGKLHWTWNIGQSFLFFQNIFYLSLGNLMHPNCAFPADSTVIGFSKNWQSPYSGNCSWSYKPPKNYPLRHFSILNHVVQLWSKIAAFKGEP